LIEKAAVELPHRTGAQPVADDAVLVSNELLATRFEVAPVTSGVKAVKLITVAAANPSRTPIPPFRILCDIVPSPFHSLIDDKTRISLSFAEYLFAYGLRTS
jgi:hypothetical protein